MDEETLTDLSLLSETSSKPLFHEQILTFENDLLSKEAYRDETSPEFLTSLTILGKMYQKACFFQKALNCFTEILATKQAHIQESNIECVEILNDIASVETNLAYYAQAREKLNQCFKILSEHPLDEFPSVRSKTYRNSAVLCIEEGGDKTALEMINLSLDTHLKAYGDNDKSIIDIYLVRAKVYIRLCLVEQSFEDINKVLELCVLYEDMQQSGTIEANNLLGQVNRVIFKFKDSQKAFETALDLSLKYYGQDHIESAKSYEGLGVIYQRRKDDKNTLESFQTSYDINQRLFGVKHPNICIPMVYLGIYYIDEGELQQAENYLMEALEMRLDFFDKVHPDVGRTYRELGKLLEKENKYSEALKYYQETMRIYLILYGNEHNLVATTYGDIGNVYYSMNDYERSFIHHSESLKITSKLFKDKPREAVDQINVGILSGCLGNISIEIIYYKKALKTLKCHFIEGDIELASTYFNLGIAYKLSGRFNKGLRTLEKSLRIRVGIFGDEHITVASSCQSLGRIYRQMGKFSKALEVYMKSWRIRVKIGKKVYPELADSCQEIAHLYESVNDFQSSRQWLLKAYQIRRELVGRQDQKMMNLGSYLKLSELYKQEIDNNL